MQKEGIILLVAAAAVFCGSVWYFASSSPTVDGIPVATTSPLTGGSTPTLVNGKFSGSGSVTDLASFRTNLKCSVSTTGSGTKRSGTLYLTNAKARGDFTSTVSGYTVPSFMISDGARIYVWVSGTEGGIRFPTTAASTSVFSHGGVDLSSALNYDCYLWTPDPSFFVPPANVLFTDSIGN